jgi:ribulose bisphosphate carboxylase small subunit
MVNQDIKSLHVVVKAETELTQVMLQSQLQQLLEQGIMLGFVHRHVWMERGF